MSVNRQDVQDAKDKLESIESGYLAERGWNYSSEHPDSCWRWEKEIGGKIYIVSRAGALRLQEFIDEEEDLRRCDGQATEGI